MTDDPMRILVADDHTLLREALCDLLRAEPDFEVVAQAADAEEAVSLAARTRPDVALLDVQMPHNDDPLLTVRRLLTRQPTLRIIIVSMDDHPVLVRQMLAIGVRGYLHKSTSRETLFAAVREQVDTGRRTVTVSVPPPGLTPGATTGGRLLSDRETQVLTLVACALSNRQIGVRLGITEGTVKRHLRKIFDKLEAVSRIDAVNKAVGLSLIRPQQPRRLPLAG
ncbi:response regulator transcription factor [Streptomyces sp. SL13]|jgi:two-component system nitrate/nitrite response regulator NarL|uniref:Response regulator transcription factor n=1 Tax=Streptantibioticus silvisoli TaxID=2705255 RepID=A0AA90KKE3_9ACTN|nr:response regulator transcription factor [Streptantibioticus silvisoli]MDI5967002.1 response regulator transcription factor [Streptantibioticus silvisoli]MDI5974519.1 response regulator transcription factor [Streptantibioticus silvisoli]